MAIKSFAVIGLGNFGKSVASALIQNKCEVTVFDNNEGKITNFQGYFPTVNAIISDVENPLFFEEQNIKNFNGIILAIATDLEVGLLTAINLNKLGCSNLIVRAKDEIHARILKHMGIQNIILPDRKIGKIIAFQALYGLKSNVQIINEKYGLAEIKVTNPDEIGYSLEELNLLNKKNYNIVYIFRNNNLRFPAEIEELKLNDRLFIVGTLKHLSNLEEKFAAYSDKGFEDSDHLD